MLTTKELRERRAAKIKRMGELRDKHKTGTWTDENRAEWESLNKEVDSLHEQIQVIERQDQLEIDLAAPIRPGLADELRHQGVPEWNGSNGRDDRNEGILFRDTRTGQLVRSIGAHQQVSRTIEHDAGDEGLDFGRLLRGILTGREGDMTDAERRTIMTIGGSAGGYLLNQQMSSILIDMARSASVCLKAGAQTIPMETSELTIARITSDPEAVWAAEGQAVNATGMTFARYTLRARSLKCIVPVTIEAWEDCENIGQIVTNALRAAMGLALDQAALTGPVDGGAPLSLTHTAGVHAIDNVGVPEDYSDARAAVEKILGANFAGNVGQLAWIMNPRDGASFDSLHDGEGRPMQASPWVSALRRLYTTSLAADAEEKTLSFIGDFSQMAFGMRTSGVVIRVLESGTVLDSDEVTIINATSEFKKLVVAHLRADTVCMRPPFFAKLGGLEAAGDE
ncbi:MAG: phage major capsid protein [Pirellulaceae bacterium]|nr:phage major capsid protein [Pirellulaceae bacterium]